MRTYPRNSPEAAGRLLALVLLVDGHVCRRELDALQQQGVAAALGALLREVDEPRLQREVLRLAQSVAAADHHLADGEHFLLDAARRYWRVEEGLGGSAIDLLRAPVARPEAGA